MKTFYIVVAALLVCTAGTIIWKYTSADQGEFKGVSRLSIPISSPIPDAVGLSCLDAVARFGNPHIKISFHDTLVDHENKLCNVIFHNVEKWDDCDAPQNGYAVIALHSEVQMFIEHAFVSRLEGLGLTYTFALFERGHYIVIQFRDGIVIGAENLHAQLVGFNLKP